MWHCAHLVLKIFSPAVGFPGGASENDAIAAEHEAGGTWARVRVPVRTQLEAAVAAAETDGPVAVLRSLV